MSTYMYERVRYELVTVRPGSGMTRLLIEHDSMAHINQRLSSSAPSRHGVMVFVVLFTIMKQKCRNEQPSQLLILTSFHVKIHWLLSKTRGRKFVGGYPAVQFRPWSRIERVLSEQHAFDFGFEFGMYDGVHYGVKHCRCFRDETRHRGQVRVNQGPVSEQAQHGGHCVR